MAILLFAALGTIAVGAAIITVFSLAGRSFRDALSAGRLARTQDVAGIQ